jgi:hypothetical protein
MDWPLSPSGGDLQEAWARASDVFGWAVLLWAGIAAILVLLTIPMATRAVRRRHFWCERAGSEVEVEFEEYGLVGFRRAVAVLRCSLFDPPTAVDCRRGCLTGDVRVRLPMTLPRPWRKT